MYLQMPRLRYTWEYARAGSKYTHISHCASKLNKYCTPGQSTARLLKRECHGRFVNIPSQICSNRDAGVKSAPTVQLGAPANASALF